jgi:hypothetical protein
MDERAVVLGATVAACALVGWCLFVRTPDVPRLVVLLSRSCGVCATAHADLLRHGTLARFEVVYTDELDAPTRRVLVEHGFDGKVPFFVNLDRRTQQRGYSTHDELMAAVVGPAA